ncbi:hypothetical protein F8M41_011018 [Gigaspora margarita]|uniref:Uncharacterized protein n=1 Tax=Gigaspora margarita TaxID=4874 RepID=A0A8H3WZR3_GIGMA|nr:hypothetical protein F8M41_011018 [Gigaspora margarita]
MSEFRAYTTEQIKADFEFDDEFKRIQNRHYNEHRDLESERDDEREKLKQKYDNEHKQLKNKQYQELKRFASNPLHHRQNRKPSKKLTEFRAYTTEQFKAYSEFEDKFKGIQNKHYNEYKDLESKHDDECEKLKQKYDNEHKQLKNKQYQELKRFASNPLHHRQNRKYSRKQDLELKEFTSNSLGRQNRPNSKKQVTKRSQSTYPPSGLSAEQQNINLSPTINQPSNQPNPYSYNLYSSTPSGPSKKPITEQPNQYLFYRNSFPNMERPLFVGSNANDCEFGIIYDPSIYSAPLDFSTEQQDTNPFLTINQPSNQPNLYLYNTYSNTPSGPSREPTTEQQSQYLLYCSSSETNSSSKGWPLMIPIIDMTNTNDGSDLGRIEAKSYN